MNKFLLSVIIPTRNRSSLLKRALISIINQSFSPERFEVIVVDNGSNDNTKTICNKFSKKIDNFRYEFVSQPGLHVGRHVGLRKAKSDVLVFADDDIKAFPTWLEGIIESFKDLEVALVGGKNLPLYESEPLEWVQALWKNIEYGIISQDTLKLDVINGKINIDDLKDIYFIIDEAE